ncbi:vWA domain-containing protein [Actinomycetospora callitridis]|uniref:vWA domain-containing protein n=1 Tax=Actinomycetospora callitridis TaxID=913944 RepID=UPI0023669540|nr:VWA domain-containing protein [Actinomycetospora callitridis]MDD7919754.1 VWA domain-containing protein [Actinomycetospora callitridis]
MSTGDRGGSSDGLAPRPHAGAVLASGVVETLGGDTDLATEADGGPDAVLEDFVAFTRLVRNAGVPVTTDRVAAYLQALRLSDLTSEVSTYWAGRLTLCADPDDVVRYDHAFAAWFSADPRDQRMGRPAPPKPRISTMAALTEPPPGSGQDGEEEETPELRVAASGEEILRDRDIAELSIGEREHLKSLLALLRPAPPKRRARRRRPARRGEPDPRRTLRAALANGGEIGEMHRRRRRERPRRVVLLVDVSGSMSPYADTLLRFAHVLTRRTPTSVETFTLGTRLTRVTRELRQRDPERALGDAARAIPDWSGGTRLGEALRAFLDRWGQRGVARRAVVVVFSDGWERGGAELLGEQSARLARLAHKVVWVNPHAGKSGYAPVQGGIAAALPHVDRLLAGHSLTTLAELLEVLRDA